MYEASTVNYSSVLFEVLSCSVAQAVLKFVPLLSQSHGCCDRRQMWAITP